MNLPNVVSTIVTLLALGSNQPQVAAVPHVPQILSQVEYSLNDRYSNTFVNNVFSDNILLTLSYMDGQTKEGDTVNWDDVRKPTTYEFLLQPGKTFAFHDLIEDQYTGTVTQTTNAHFNSTEGFKSDGYLVGDGVCHFASFIHVAAREAGLDVVAPTRHDFAAIPDVSRDDGTAIYYTPDDKSGSSKQNLYVTNTTTKTIAFVFTHTDTNTLVIAIEEVE
jgi:hypothetical protein